MAADSSGNLYVTGSSDRTYSDGDIVTLKYTPAGVLRWEARYTAPGGSYAEGFALAVDSSKNVYVTGFQTDPLAGRILVLLKYDSLGHQQWMHTNGGGSDSDNVGIGIVVDPVGNSYILGYSYSRQTDYDIVLLAYTPAGDLRWIRRFDGIAHGTDLPAAVVLNRSCTRVAVTGTTQGAGGDLDIVTAQYDAAGSEIWHSFYASPGNDQAFGLVSDKGDTLTVAGISDQSGQRKQYLLVRYAPDGSQLWTSLYAGQYAGEKILTGVALNAVEDIIVTGVLTPSTNPDYLTVRFDHTTGAIRWEIKYDNTNHGSDYPIGLVVSPEGSIYVTGTSRYGSQDPFSFLTIKYDSTGHELFVARYNISGNDVYTSNIVSDNTGNVYVCGAAVGRNYDILILKYRSNLRGDWSAVFGNGENRAVPGTFLTDRSGNSYMSGWDGTALFARKADNISHPVWALTVPGLVDARTVGSVLDPNGDLYLAGSIRNTAGNLDILTVKISPLGELLWTRTYDGPDAGDDAGVAIGLDSTGNVLVTGSSHSPATLDDIVLLRYKPDGTLRWVSRYNFPYDHDDDPVDLAIDGAGNSYVAATIVRPVSSYDIALLKFDSLGGQRWVRFYNGTGGGIDQAKAVLLNRYDSLYVVGNSYSGPTGTDIVLLKYDTAGTQAWVSRYSGGGSNSDQPTGLAIDSTGCPVVVGVSTHQTTGIDCITIKFDPNGTVIWEAEYDGPTHGNDIAQGVTIDRLGSVYVGGTSLGVGTGNDMITIRYTSDGWLDWVQRFNGEANLDDGTVGIMNDSIGNVYLGGTSENDSGGVDAVFLKYSSPIIEYWPVEYDGPGTSNDSPVDLAIDPAGNADIAATGGGDYASLFYEIMQYGPDGGDHWHSQYNGGGSQVNVPVAISVDNTGGPVVTGLTQQGLSNYDFGTIAYTQDGTVRWIQLYTGPTNGINFPSVIACAPNQTIGIAGYTLVNGAQYDFALASYTLDGSRRWNSTYDDPGGGNDVVTAAVTDPGANTYLTGLVSGGGIPMNWETVKFDSGGTVRWAVTYDGPDHLDDRAVAIARDSAGSLFVTGWSAGALTEHDIAVVKYDSGGQKLWDARYDGPAHDRDEPVAIAVDRNGFVDVAGISYDASFSTPEIVLLQYSPGGTLQWSRRFAADTGSDNIPAAMVLDTAGNWYLTASFTDPGSTSGVITLKFSPDGTLLWSSRYRESSGLACTPAGLAIDHAGNLVIAASTRGSQWSVITAIGYLLHGTAAVPGSASLPARFRLDRNYPNPFNPSTNIGYALPVRSRVRIEVCNMLGQAVRTLVDREEPAGLYSENFTAGSLASGVYFVRMRAERFDGASPFVASEKILLLK